MHKFVLIFVDVAIFNIFNRFIFMWLEVSQALIRHCF